MIWVQDQMAHLLDRSDTDEPPGTSTVAGCFDDGLTVGAGVCPASQAAMHVSAGS